MDGVTPLERAARAACRSEYSDGEDDWIEAAKCRRWQMFLPQVRATIAAIREPSEISRRAVIAATDDRDFRTAVSTTGLSEEEADRFWTGMIDAVLAEEL